jgi:hypothetical protein
MNVKHTCKKSNKGFVKTDIVYETRYTTNNHSCTIKTSKNHTYNVIGKYGCRFI